MANYADNVHKAAHAILSTSKFKLGDSDNGVSFPDPDLVAKLAAAYTAAVDNVVAETGYGFQQRDDVILSRFPLSTGQ